MDHIDQCLRINTSTREHYEEPVFLKLHVKREFIIYQLPHPLPADK